jgi:hypothetical protein
MPVDFFLSSRDPEESKADLQYMHLHLVEPMWAYFVDIRDLVDTAGLAHLDPYSHTVWDPDEAGPMADRLRTLYESIAAAGDQITSLLEPTLVPPLALGLMPVLDFLFWSRKLFVEAGHRRMFVYAVGE